MDRPYASPWRLIRPALTHGAVLTCALAFVPLAPAQTPPSPAPEPLVAPQWSIPSNQWRPEAVSVFFPPAPPALGGVIDRRPTYVPLELGAYVNETFYPSLGTRLDTKGLSASLRLRLEYYRATKLALQNELRAELDRQRDAEPATRMQELSVFSRRQTPRLVELEVAAEQLRRDLTRSSQAWGAIREWHLSDRDPRGYTPAEVANVMRAAAYYEDDLSVVQRGLLRETSIELGAASDSAAHATTAQPYLFFSPAPARVLLPSNLPVDVASKLAAYETKKSALKKELYDAIYARDSAKPGFLRGHPLKSLATEQAARITELETLADEIRRGLAETMTTVAERSPLPPTLQSRLNRIVTDHFAAQKETAAKIDAILAAAKDVRINWKYAFDGGQLIYEVRPTPSIRRTTRSMETYIRAEDAKRVDAVRADVAAVAEAYARRLAGFIREREAIRAETVATLGATPAEQIESALVTALSLAVDRDAAETYREYHLAVFQPGLSPEQRRLLFDGAIERLQLPLPRGERQPTRRTPVRPPR